MAEKQNDFASTDSLILKCALNIIPIGTLSGLGFVGGYLACRNYEKSPQLPQTQEIRRAEASEAFQKNFFPIETFPMPCLEKETSSE